LQLFLQSTLLALQFFVLFEVAVELIVELGTIDARESLAAEVDEQLGEFAVSHHFVDCENGAYSSLVDGTNEVAEVCLFGHLEHDFGAELLCMYENIGEFGVHDGV
jgi:hypothetical protein